MDPEEAFALVERLLYRIAHDTSKWYLIPLDECLSECFFAFVKAFNWRWDPDKGTKFSTTVHTIAKWRMKNLVLSRIEERRRRECMLELTDETDLLAPPIKDESLEHLESLVDDMSETAKELFALLIKTPEELIGKREVSPRRLLEKVTAHLESKGIPRKELRYAQREIKAQFTRAWAI